MAPSVMGDSSVAVLCRRGLCEADGPRPWHPRAVPGTQLPGVRLHPKGCRQVGAPVAWGELEGTLRSILQGSGFALRAPSGTLLGALLDMEGSLTGCAAAPGTDPERGPAAP